MAFRQRLEIEMVVPNGLLAAFQASASELAERVADEYATKHGYCVLLQQIGNTVTVTTFDRAGNIDKHEIETYADAWIFAQQRLRIRHDKD